jgi:hypothetical protein
VNRIVSTRIMAGRPLFAYTDFISHPNQPAENRLHPF